MKLFKFIIVIIFLSGCSTTELVENWKNPDIDSYSPNKVLLVGMTSNSNARKQFENYLKTEFTERGIESVTSLEFFDDSFSTKEKTEENLKKLENKLLSNGFDTILFTKVIGVEDVIAYKENYDGYDETYKRFSEDYLKYQDAYYNPDYYNEYTVYHAETSMYCICPTKDRELIWKGYIDIVDPKSINETINNYVNLVMAVLEDQQLISPKVLNTPKTDHAI
ncbi:hypothetical protein [Flavisericum labens]|uniref:hypothetical protein n=1 Tax=Flavisericum labens TaxID=3377112 RepID=UPI00387AD6FF